MYLLAVAKNIVHDESESEECLYDTYNSVWNSIPPARPAVLQSFLTAVMRRTAINRYNANRCQKRIMSEYTVSLSELGDFITDDNGFEKDFESKELSALISNYVRSLSDRQMYIFVSRYYLAESLSEIADELGCSISTVKREIVLIKDGLKKNLESEGYAV